MSDMPSPNVICLCVILKCITTIIADPSCVVRLNEINTQALDERGANEFIEIRYLCFENGKYVKPRVYPTLKGYAITVVAGLRQNEGTHGSKPAIVFTAILPDYRPRQEYYVIGKGPAANLDMGSPKVASSNDYRTRGRGGCNALPDGDGYPHAIVLMRNLNDQQATALLPTRGNPIVWIGENVATVLASHVADMIIYGRKTAFYRCPIFERIAPRYRHNSYIVREFDVRNKDYSLNKCVSPEQDLAYTPEMFKLGVPSPGLENDCSGGNLILETFAKCAKSIRVPEGCPHPDNTGSECNPLPRTGGCVASIPEDVVENIADDQVDAFRKAVFLQAGTDPVETGLHHFTLYEKAMIYKVWSFFNIGVMPVRILPEHANRLTASALQIDRSSVFRIVTEYKEKGFLSPSGDRRNHRPCIEFDQPTRYMVRLKIFHFYQAKRYPTVASLLASLREVEDFVELSRSTLLKWLKLLGMRYVKKDNRNYLTERGPVREARFVYLKQMNRYRQSGYNIYYQDETWVNSNHSPDKCWQEIVPSQNPYLPQRRQGGFDTKSGKGQRLIVNHIGSSAGFVDGAADIFVSKTDQGDYHTHMNTEHWLKWFEAILHLIPAKSVIVVDNARYHNHVDPLDKYPPTSRSKKQILEWIIAKDPSRTPSELSGLTKYQLMDIARRLPVSNQYQTDKLAAKLNRDIHVLRLPVAHCELNPIELAWAAVKKGIGKRNTKFTIRHVESLAKEEILKVGAEQWTSYEAHVRKVEDAYWDADGIIDFADVAPLIIPLDDDDDDDPGNEYIEQCSECADQLRNDCLSEEEPEEPDEPEL